MKRRIFAFILLLSILLTGCAGTYGQVNLQEPVAIPENGIISESIVKQLQKEHAIGTFRGESNGFSYEWTIFGSDISDANEINLRIEISRQTEGLLRFPCPAVHTVTGNLGCTECNSLP